ncbi:MAG TPA: S8 family serine peptidase [Porticoccaceae bacterium]|nr:S8 family serine peptidase [Porticoccaceae bacterium]
MSHVITQHATRNTQHATRHRLSIAALLSGLLLVSVAVHAQQQETANEEGPYLEGVCAREAGPPLILPVKMSQHEPAPLFDAEGTSNSVIVLLDFDHPAFDPVLSGKAKPGDQIVAEQAMLKAINAKAQATEMLFSNPERARYLIPPDDRLGSESRALLSADHPEELLHRFLVLRYLSVDAAKAATDYLQKQPGVLSAGIDKKLDFLWAPNDPYFPINSMSAGRYQWGMHAMNFPSAWDRTKGHGYVAAIDGGQPNNQPHADLAANYRSQFSFETSTATDAEFHGAHVLGIIGATANNGVGVAGGCPSCSVAMVRWSGVTSASASAMYGLIERGVQVINMSFGLFNKSCSNAEMTSLCGAIDAAVSRDVMLVAAAGNAPSPTPQFPASHGSVLAVGGAENVNPAAPGQWVQWFYGVDSIYGYNVGSADPGAAGVMAPAQSIVSTVPAGSNYISTPSIKCGDVAGSDESEVYGDGYGSCTGTSMAAPHVSALAGILRSINPRLSRTAIRDRIRASGSDFSNQTPALGSGMPNARTAVDQTIAQTLNKLTPLFSMYSSGRLDYFYTTVPQMAAAAAWGTLRPVNSTAGTSYASVGTGITSYGSFPGAPSTAVPKAEVWLFTTPENPKSASIPLVPLYRLSWKCGDPTSAPPTICSSNANHMDVTYTADTAGVNAFKSAGYKLDGIEGYLYPKTMTQPLGTARLMRKYNPARDDHAIFPESQLSAMAAQGYTQNSGSDWIGYVYPNTNGNVPAIN